MKSSIVVKSLVHIVVTTWFVQLFLNLDVCSLYASSFSINVTGHATSLIVTKSSFFKIVTAKNWHALLLYQAYKIFVMRFIFCGGTNYNRSWSIYSLHK